MFGSWKLLLRSYQKACSDLTQVLGDARWNFGPFFFVLVCNQEGFGTTVHLGSQFCSWSMANQITFELPREFSKFASDRTNSDGFLWSVWCIVIHINKRTSSVIWGNWMHDRCWWKEEGAFSILFPAIPVTHQDGVFLTFPCSFDWETQLDTALYLSWVLLGALHQLILCWNERLQETGMPLAASSQPSRQAMSFLGLGAPALHVRWILRESSSLFFCS